MRYNRRNAGNMGIEELVGQELVVAGEHMGIQELVGALRNRGVPPGEAKAIAEDVLSREGNSAIVREVDRSNLTRQYLPIPITNVGAGLTVGASVQPQALYRTKRVMIPSTIAADFRLAEFKIGQKPQFVQDGSIPCTCLSEVAVNGDVNFDSADYGVIMSLRAENTSAGALDFEGTLIGLTAN